MMWFRKDDAFAEAIRPELSALRTPPASPELRERILRDRAVGMRIILPADGGAPRTIARYVIAAVLVVAAVLALPFYHATRNDARNETRDVQPTTMSSFLGGVVGAQEAPSIVPNLPPALPAHPERVRAGSLDYSRVWRDSANRVVRRVNEALAIATRDSAWRIVEIARDSSSTFVETLFVAKRDLRLLARSVHVRPYRKWNGINIEQRFNGDSVNGQMTLDDVSGMRPIARRLPPASGPYIADALVPVYFASVPLATSWQGRVAALGWAVVPNDVFTMVDLRVTGEEDVQVPAGRFSCWKMVVHHSGGSLDFWVRKSDRIVVRVLERQENGGSRELALVRDGGA
jgi:hypothetical protein